MKYLLCFIQNIISSFVGSIQNFVERDVDSFPDVDGLSDFFLFSWCYFTGLILAENQISIAGRGTTMVKECFNNGFGNWLQFLCWNGILSAKLFVNESLISILQTVTISKCQCWILNWKLHFHHPNLFCSYIFVPQREYETDNVLSLGG